MIPVKHHKSIRILILMLVILCSLLCSHAMASDLSNCPSPTASVYLNSYAQEYYVRNGIPYVLLDSEATPELTAEPTLSPSGEPTPEPTEQPTLSPTAEPTFTPEPTKEPLTTQTPDGFIIETGVLTKYIGNAADLVIPDNLEICGIGASAFSGNDKLTNVSIPEGVRFIRESAFSNCSFLRSIHIPASVTTIENGAFAGCTMLTQFDVNESNSCFCSWDGMLFDMDCTVLLSYPACTDGALDLPDTVTTIGDCALQSCDGLSSVTVPDGVTDIGRYAFWKCGNLNSIDLPDGLIRIGGGAFEGCSNLADIAIPDGVTSIGSWAFEDCTQLTSIAIPDSVVSVGQNLFEGCYNLTRVDIGSGLKKLRYHMFTGCNNLTEVYVASVESWLNMTVESELANPMYYADKLYFDGVLAENISIPETISFIRNDAFLNCRTVKRIGIPDTIDAIGSNAFNCPNLEMLIFFGTDMPTLGNNIFNTVPTLYCHEFSDVDYWAMDCDYPCVYLHDLNMIDLVELTLPESCPLLLYDVRDLKSYLFPQQAASHIKWTSSAPDVISVDNGTITALSIGSATITASYGTHSASIDVASYATIDMPAQIRLFVGESTTVVPKTRPSLDPAQIVWESSAPEIVSVENGTITALSVGEAVITASWNGFSDSMTVISNRELTDFQLSETELWIVTKTTAQIDVIDRVHPDAQSDFVYESSNTAIFTVSNSGCITARKPGNATLYVSADNGIVRECAVHVCYPVTAIELTAAQSELLIREPVQLKATVTAYSQTFENRLITFSSSDEAIASVDANGLVTGVSAGKATITAASASGVSASYTFNVRSDGVLILPKSVTSVEAEAFAGTQIKAVLLPDGCERIGASAFAGNDTLRFIWMPDSVRDIADNAFAGCSNVRFLCESENAAADYARSKAIPYQIK